MALVQLGDRCLSRPDCEGHRLPYAGYCRACGPPTTPLPPTRCQLPVRCYCPSCATAAGSTRHMLGPHHSPESIRLMLAALAAQRKVTR